MYRCLCSRSLSLNPALRQRVRAQCWSTAIGWNIAHVPGLSSWRNPSRQATLLYLYVYCTLNSNNNNILYEIFITNMQAHYRQRNSLIKQEVCSDMPHTYTSTPPSVISLISLITAAGVQDWIRATWSRNEYGSTMPLLCSSYCLLVYFVFHT